MSSSTVCVELKQQQVKLASQLSHSTKPPFHWAQMTLSSGTSSDSDSDLEQFEAKHSKHHLYVHPPVKHSFSWTLSKNSLEMCTENLGCETGNSGTSSSLSLSDSEEAKFPAMEASTKLRQALRNTKANNSRSFPPPLTSISKADSVRYFRPHREGGRLVIKAVTISPPSQTCFQAERVDGRLKLRFASSAYSKEEGEEEDEEEEEDIGGDNRNDGGEMGIEKCHQRHFRCKEEGENGNKSLLNFESFWVVT